MRLIESHEIKVYLGMPGECNGEFVDEETGLTFTNEQDPLLAEKSAPGRAWPLLLTLAVVFTRLSTPRCICFICC